MNKRQSIDIVLDGMREQAMVVSSHLSVNSFFALSHATISTVGLVFFSILLIELLIGLSNVAISAVCRSIRTIQRTVLCIKSTIVSIKPAVDACALSIECVGKTNAPIGIAVELNVQITIAVEALIAAVEQATCLVGAFVASIGRAIAPTGASIDAIEVPIRSIVLPIDRNGRLIASIEAPTACPFVCCISVI
jgi:hypothetical protein